MTGNTIGTPLTTAATRVMLLGSGELGKEVAIELQRLGVEADDGDNGVRTHAVIGNQSSGLKSRAGNCSFTPLVLRSIM